MPDPNVLTPWILQTHELKPVAHWREVGRYNSKAATERAAVEMGLPSVRIAFARVPVAIAEDESRN